MYDSDCSYTSVIIAETSLVLLSTLNVALVREMILSLRCSVRSVNVDILAFSLKYVLLKVRSLLS